MKTIIVNADDYGLTKGISKGIRHGYTNGIITSTTIMSCGENLEDDLQKLKFECVGIGKGIHLTLTNFKPVSNPQNIPSLINQDNNFYTLNELIKNRSTINSEELYNEWQNQIEFILEKGLKIDHLDSHHHVAFLSKTTVDVFIQLSKKYEVPIRLIDEKSFIDKEMHEYTKYKLRQNRIKSNDFFIWRFTKNDGDLNLLLEDLKNLDNGITEIVTHAGFNSLNLEGISSKNKTREQELNTLVHGKILKYIQSNKIKLSTFKELL